MSTISLLRMWNDPGFTDGCVEVPAFDHLGTLPNADITIGTAGTVSAEINPSKGRLFSELKLKRAYSDCQNLSYLEMIVDYNTGYDRIYFGFIDSVEILSDTDDYPAVLIKWHVDLWRTYLSGAVFGYGLVTRRNRQTVDPPQRVTCRYKLPGEFTPLRYTGPGSNLFWVILTFTTEDDNHRVTECRTMVFPVDPNSTITRHYLKIDGHSETVTCPSLAEIINGDYDELFGISSSTVSSVFITPYPPLAISSVSGTTVTLATASAGSTSEYVTVRVNTFPVYLTSFTMRGQNYWQDVYIDWSNSEGQSGTEHFTTDVGVRDWLRNHQGARDQYTYCKINGSNVNWRMVYNVNTFINACLSNQYTPVDGDTFTFDRVYHSVTFTEETQSEWTTTLSGTLAVNGVATYSNGAWHIGNNDTIAFDAPPGASYTHVQGSESYSVNIQQTQGSYGFAYSGNGNYPEQTIAFTPLTTTDTKEWFFTDMNGCVIGSIPWGITVSSLNERLVVNATSAYIEFRESIDSHLKGTVFSVPLPAVDVTSNSWSDYVYSGSREADITNRRLANEQALATGLMSSISGGAQGAMLGGLKESQSFLPSDRTIANATMFGALGAGAGLASAVGNYAIGQYYNDRIQGVADVQQAKQFDSIVSPGSGWDWLWHGRECGFVSMVGDDYSLDRFTESVRENGIEVSEPTADCTALIHGVGPLRIENLIVRGNIPAEAKQYIKQKINSGVRLV